SEASESPATRGIGRKGFPMRELGIYGSRIPYLGMVLAIVLVPALLSPESRQIMLGYCRGEHFYRGKPASYWRGAILAYWSQFGKRGGLPRRPATVLDSMKAFYRVGRPQTVAVFPPFEDYYPRPDGSPGVVLYHDPKAVPVLIDLLK